MCIYFPAFFTFSPQMAHSSDASLFPHMTFQSLGYFTKLSVAFRVCPSPPWDRLEFFRAVFTEKGKKRGRVKANLSENVNNAVGGKCIIVTILWFLHHMSLLRCSPRNLGQKRCRQ